MLLFFLSRILFYFLFIPALGNSEKIILGNGIASNGDFKPEFIPLQLPYTMKSPLELELDRDKSVDIYIKLQDLVRASKFEVRVCWSSIVM
jgi:hypothetical protein